MQNLADSLFEQDFFHNFTYYETLEECYKMVNPSDNGFLYLFNCDKYNQDTEFEFKESTYKFGKTELNLQHRLKQYKTINIKQIYAIQCNDSSSREKYLKNFLSTKTNLLPIIGQEYFSGCFELLRILFYIFGKIELTENLSLNNFDEIIELLIKIQQRAIKTKTNEFIFDIKDIKYLQNKTSETIFENVNNISSTCEYCEKIFSTKQALTYHKKTAKFCIKLQKENSNASCDKIENFVCKFCDKNFVRKSIFMLHELNCKKKDNNNSIRIRELEQKEIELKYKLKEKEDQISTLEKENILYKNQVEHLKDTINILKKIISLN